ncbi:MAG: Ig-like domain-containing protein, partial [Acidimicrobiales bacterium]|nr:Ig-like domain-containing protein [Acidimicrobiales bacterium]
AGNPGAAADTTADTGAVTVDNTHPTVSVFSFDDTAMKTGDTPTLTLTFSEAVAAFASSADVSCPNGALATMTSANSGVTWTGTFTPTADVDDDTNTCSLATSYTDANGNTGPSASTANYAIDTEAPTASSISMDDTALKAGDTATLTIVFSETVAGFASADDVVCATGSLAAMSLDSGTTWTGTFTPTDDTDDSTNVCTLATSYTDSAGNTGTAATSANYDVDTLDPAVSSISLSDTDVITGDTPTLTIVFSSAVSGFASGDDVTCPNGALATMSSSDDITWTGTFTPTSSTTDTSNTCDVGTGYTDDAGNSGATGQSANYKVDTVAPTVSSISFADTALKAGETSLVTFVFSEAVAGFANGDLTIQGGTLSAVADGGDSITWTATFTPTTNTEDNTNVLSIAANSYTDTLGNNGGAGQSANYEVETLKPTASTIAMTTSNSNSAYAKSGDTITLTITMSESVSGLVCTIDGEATTMGGSGTSWTSALQLSGDETEQSTVFSCASATDAAGNAMDADTSADTGAVTVDLTVPIVGIGTVATDGYINAAEASSFTITGTASGADGQTVTVTYGGASETATVSNSGTWTLTMCDDESCSHSAGLSAVTANVNDLAGNAATEADVNAWYDATAPTSTVGSVDISADTGSSDSDFITKTAAQTVSATLSAALATGETLEISINAGSSWTEDDHATADGTGVSIAVTLSGSSSIKLRIVDAAGNAGAVSTTTYVLDTTAPTSTSATIATSGSGNANDGDIVTLTLDPS